MKMGLVKEACPLRNRCLSAVADRPLTEKWVVVFSRLQKGGDPAAPSGTATLLRLSPSRWFYPNPC